MKFKLVLLLLPLLANSQDYNAKMISAPVSDIVTKIAAYDIITGESSGYSGGPSPQYLEYLKLAEKASLRELKELTNHPNPVMRCYAFNAICEKRDTDLILEIAKKHVTDHTIMKAMSGCVVYEKMVGDAMLKAATYGDEYHKRVLSESQVNEFDRFIIASNSKLTYKETAIEKLQATKENYAKVRQLVTEENSKGALTKLAEYKKESDVPLFIDLFNSIEESDNDYLSYHAFNKAVATYPHPEFFPLLKFELRNIVTEKYINNGWQALYDAIAAYGNSESVSLLSVPFYEIDWKMRRYHLEFVLNATSRFPYPDYRELQWELWENDNLINVETCAALFVEDPERAYGISLKNMDIRDTEPKSAMELPKWEQLALPEQFMLYTILKNDKHPEKIMAAELKVKWFIEYYLYYIQEDPNPVFIEQLFTWLTSESRYSADVAETLLQYNDDTINERLLEIRKTDPRLKENEPLNELLKAKGLIP